MNHRHKGTTIKVVPAPASPAPKPRSPFADTKKAAKLRAEAFRLAGQRLVGERDFFQRFLACAAAENGGKLSVRLEALEAKTPATFKLYPSVPAGRVVLELVSENGEQPEEKKDEQA